MYIDIDADTDADTDIDINSTFDTVIFHQLPVVPVFNIRASPSFNQ